MELRKTLLFNKTKFEETNQQMGAQEENFELLDAPTTS
jgi:hypothetical protein